MPLLLAKYAKLTANNCQILIRGKKESFLHVQKLDIPYHSIAVVCNSKMGLKSVLHERFLDFGDKTSIAGLNNAVHSKSNGKYELLNE